MKRLILVAALLLTGCNNTSKPDTWCEQDYSDTRVSDSFCENGSPGYEWEPDGDDYYDSHRKTTVKQYQPAPSYKAGPTYRAPVPTYKAPPPPAYKPPPAPAYKPPPPAPPKTGK